MCCLKKTGAGIVTPLTHITRWLTLIKCTGLCPSNDSKCKFCTFRQVKQRFHKGLMYLLIRRNAVSGSILGFHLVRTENMLKGDKCRTRSNSDVAGARSLLWPLDTKKVASTVGMPRPPPQHLARKWVRSGKDVGRTFTLSHFHVKANK